MSLSPGVTYYFEPDSVLDDVYWNAYRNPGVNDPFLEQHVRKAFEGGVHTEYVIAEQQMRDILTAWRANVVLIKWVKLVLCLDWFAERFPDALVVQTIRHPVPLALSWRPRGWDPGHHLRLILDQPALTQGLLKPYVGVMQDAETFWEKTGAFWGAISYVQLHQHRPGWVLREHEWYCMDPATRIHELIGQTGLEWTDRIGRFVLGEERAETGPGYGKNRDPRTEVHKWEKHVTLGELAELESVVKRFDLPFYRGLDPEAFWQP